MTFARLWWSYQLKNKARKHKRKPKNKFASILTATGDTLRNYAKAVGLLGWKFQLADSDLRKEILIKILERIHDLNIDAVARWLGISRQPNDVNGFMTETEKQFKERIVSIILKEISVP